MKKKIIGILILSMLVVCSIFRYQQVNRDFPKATTETASIGEVVDLNGFEVVVEKVEPRTYEEVKEEYGKSSNEENEKKYYFVHLNIKNMGTEKKKFQYASISYQCENNATGYSMELIYKVNKEIVTEYKPGQEATMIVPFQLSEELYVKESWEKLNTVPQKVVFSVYPVKKEVEV